MERTKGLRDAAEAAHAEFKEREEEEAEKREEKMTGDDRECWKCGEPDDRAGGDVIIVCDTPGCRGASHLQYNDPPLQDVPAGEVNFLVPLHASPICVCCVFVPFLCHTF